MPKTFPAFILTQMTQIIARRRQAGFTMIELLIVISILGILAVAVLAAINPIEQINRGRDTGSRSDAEQALSAIDRYYAFNGYYPWQTGAGDTANKAMVWTSFSENGIQDADTCPLTEKLSQTEQAGCTGSDELKVTFVNRVTDTTYNPLFVYNRGTQGDSTYFCFEPKSKAFLVEAKARCVDAAGSGLPTDIAAADKGVICAGAEGAEGALTYTCLP